MDTELLQETFNEIRGLAPENAAVAEALTNTLQMFAAEDQGWARLSALSNGEVPGLELAELQKLSTDIREKAVANPLIKRGIALRTSYIFSKGVNIPGYDKYNNASGAGERKPGRKGAEERFFSSLVNKANVFGPGAYEKMEKAAASDGVFVLLGEAATKELRILPLHEITGVYTHPDHIDEIWGYQRTWSRSSTDTATAQLVEWYMTDAYPEKRLPGKINDVKVNSGVTAIDIRFNQNAGWTFGIPDAVAAAVWSSVYSEMVQAGRVMTKALARFAYKVTAQTSKGAQAAGIKIAGSDGAGQTASMAAGNNMTPMNQAGKTYDFGGLRPLAAMVATALEVSVVHLLSDPGAAGSSYGSASNLDMPTKRAMTNRQSVWSDFFERVVKWGTGRDVKVTFPDMDDPDLYREQQVASLAWASGLIHGDEMRTRTLEVSGIVPLHEAPPTGFMLPNNEESLSRKDIDADSEAPVDNTPVTAASPDQGRGNGAGGVDSTLNNDIL